MGLFGKDKKVLAPLFSESELEPQNADYNTVLDWLQGLSDEDYATVCKIAEIYRKANKDAAAALGIEDQPTTFIHPPAEPEAPKNFLDEDDISAAFLDDEPAKKPVDAIAKKRSRKVEVKD